MKTCRRGIHTYEDHHKWCPECKKFAQKIWEKKNKQYFVNRRDKNKNKVSLLKKQWYRSNLNRVKGNTLKRYWPGTTWQEALHCYNELLRLQNNLCAVCKKPETVTRVGDVKLRLAVDHDHSTGKVRGLLCSMCNRAEGLLNTVDVARNLVTYMEKYKN
jgi:hypothetical protein